MQSQTKRCHKCNLELSISEFCRNKRKKDGLNTVCKACNLAQSMAYHLAHRDEILEKKKARYYSDVERTRQHQREYRVARIDETRRSSRACGERYRNANPDLARERGRVNHKKNHNDPEIIALYQSQNGQCRYCGVALGNKYHIDHIVPLKRGGSTAMENIALACRTCNLSKGDKLLEEWFAIQEKMTATK